MQFRWFVERQCWRRVGMFIHSDKKSPSSRTRRFLFSAQLFPEKLRQGERRLVDFRIPVKCFLETEFIILCHNAIVDL